jgi:hypothetical protein
MIPMKKWDVANQILNDPQDLSESEGLDVLEYLVAKLAEATSAHLELGRYWMGDSSLIARVRSKQPLKGVESDCWDASVCLSGNSRGGWSDVYILSYLQGVRQTRSGPLNELSLHHADDVYWFQFKDGMFHDKGWLAAGNGEWEWVKQPGDEYQHLAECGMTEKAITQGLPITVYLKILWTSFTDDFNELVHSSDLRVSLIHVTRGRESTNLVPWSIRPPRAKSKQALTNNDVDLLGNDTLRIDLRKFRIRGGWIPGKYRVSIRVQNMEDRWNWSSEISAPIKFEIGG